MPGASALHRTHKKKFRLLKRAQFLRAVGSGRKYVAPAFVLQVADAAPEQAAPRFGLTATKKLGNAPLRNRCRRRLRALANEVLLPLAVPADYVLIARFDLPKRPYPALRADLEKALRVLKRLKAA